ncbi:MAG: bifunctional riboflavin kinase/FAD synthetase [Alphaproteobacteria bacterium]|nr:bifunctional riboflavin kinase/FAD synthetase [Alphaproteobacteria bacterium]
MQIVRHYSDPPNSSRGAVVAIGNFDGVHLGHQALLAHAGELAKARGAPLGVLVFEPHPQEFFKPQAECFRLTPLRTKARLLAQHGVQNLYALPFDAEMAGKSSSEFVADVLVRGIGARGVVVGADFRFGKGRTGDAAFLAEAGRHSGLAVDVFDPVRANGSDKISSSDIRKALRNAKPEEAADLLGHWWTIEGRVEHGAARGKTLGYPTANMRLDGYLKPAFGIYAVRATLVENEKPAALHCGVASLGIRPMFSTETPLLETFLFDFSGDLYGKHLAVELVAYLRPEMKFDTVEQLKAQMATDCEAAAAALDRAGVRC